jgi:hypothetical protein
MEEVKHYQINGRYRLNNADTEQRKHLFWESGVLNTCKATSQAQIKKIYDWGNEPCPHDSPFGVNYKRECDKCWSELKEG